MSSTPKDPKPGAGLPLRKLWGSGPNRVPAGEPILKSLLVGCIAHVVLLLGLALMVEGLYEFTTWRRGFCRPIAALAVCPLFWLWHWTRNAGWRLKDGLELQHRGPTALILVLPIFWLFMLWQVVFGAVRP